jgi:hypothetical protein
MAHLRFFTELNAEVRVSIGGDTPEELRQAVLRAQRAFGQVGWRCSPLPPGGFHFPLANEPDFDWRLLGARRGGPAPWRAKSETGCGTRVSSIPAVRWMPTPA